jgi:hypothetical protein
MPSRLHNRQIQAAFWMDGEVSAWPEAKQLLYIGLIQLCDDSACLEHDAFEIKQFLFLRKAHITEEVIEGYLQEMIRARKLIPYKVRGKSYLYLKNFFRYQRLRSPAPPECPLPKWVEWVQSSQKYRSGNYKIHAPYGDGSFVTGQQSDRETEQSTLKNDNRTETVQQPYGNRTETVRPPRARENKKRTLEENRNRNQGTRLPDTDTGTDADDSTAPLSTPPGDGGNNFSPRDKGQGQGQGGRQRIPQGHLIEDGVAKPASEVSESTLDFYDAHAENPKAAKIAREEKRRRLQQRHKSDSGGAMSPLGLSLPPLIPIGTGTNRGLEEIIKYAIQGSTLCFCDVHAAALSLSGHAPPTDTSALQVLVSKAIVQVQGGQV